MENSIETLKERLENLENQAAVANLIHTYAQNIRKGEGQACVELFARDGIFEIRDAPPDSESPPHTRARLTGHDQIEKYLAHGDASSARVCPTIHNLLIRIDGDKAFANSVMTATVWPDGKRIVGEYNDDFVYQGAWLFASRTFDILGQFES